MVRISIYNWLVYHDSHWDWWQWPMIRVMSGPQRSTTWWQRSYVDHYGMIHSAQYKWWYCMNPMITGDELIVGVVIMVDDFTWIQWSLEMSSLLELLSWLMILHEANDHWRWAYCWSCYHGWWYYMKPMITGDELIVGVVIMVDDITWSQWSLEMSSLLEFLSWLFAWLTSTFYFHCDRFIKCCTGSCRAV